MDKFSKENHYKVTYDPSILDPSHNLAVKLCPAGVNLILDYYKDKYHTNISSTTSAFALSAFLSSEERLAELQQKGATKDNYREAILFNPMNVHTTLVVYIKENGKEAILYNDSLGVQSRLDRLKQFAEICAKKNIFLLCVFDPRQADLITCHTDGTLTGKDVTEFDPIRQQYKIPDLLERLLDPKRATLIENETNLYDVKLIDELLKVAQLSSFVNKNKEETNNVIKKGKTLLMFRDEHTDRNIDILTKDQQKVTKNIASYGRKKGIKFADIIEIQFYLNEMKKEFPLSDDQRKEFIKNAKQVFKDQRLSHDIENRPGLHQFAEEFLSRLKNELNVNSNANANANINVNENINKPSSR